VEAEEAGDEGSQLRATVSALFSNIPEEKSGGSRTRTLAFPFLRSFLFPGRGGKCTRSRGP
jgi:hypothetical protein